MCHYLFTSFSTNAGFVEEPNKGTLEYTGCNDSKGRGEEGGEVGERKEDGLESFWFSYIYRLLSPSLPFRKLAAQARTNCQRANTILSKVRRAKDTLSFLAPSF